MHSLDASVVYTKYIQDRGPSTWTAMLAWASAFKLSTVVDLGVGAQASVSQTSAVVTDLTMTTLVVTPAPASYYASATATQTLSFTPTPRQVYGEALAVSQLRYVGGSTALPTTTVVTGKLRGGWLFAHDTLFLEPSASDSFSSGSGTTTTGTITTAIPPGSQVIAAQLMAGWQHEVGIAWSTVLSAGPLAIIQTDRDTVYNFAALASISFHRLPWFASLSVSQVPVPNLYIGALTLNDDAFLRAAVPLTRNQLLFLAAYGGYLYARIADTQGNLHHAFDLITAGASLNYKFQRHPLAMSLLYTISDQHGVPVPPATSSLDIERQTLMVTLTGVFSWGPGTLPLFMGTLGQDGI